MLANVSPGIFLAIFNDETIITIKIIIVLINFFILPGNFDASPTFSSGRV